MEREIEVGAEGAALLSDGVVEEFAVAGGEDREPLDEPGGEARPVRCPPPGAAGRRGLGARDPAPRPVARGPASGPGGEPDRGQPRAAAPGGRAPVGADRGAHDHQRLRRGVHLDDRPAGSGRSRPWPSARTRAAGRCWPTPTAAGRSCCPRPIILYDHPELAAESPGELYDGTEIDEILTLRTLALSDAGEGRGPGHRSAGGRADQPRRVHGRADHGADARHHPRASPDAARHRMSRASRSATERRQRHATATTSLTRGRAVPWWVPEAEGAVSPDTDSVMIDGQKIARGSPVRLRPGARRSDAQDMFLTGGSPRSRRCCFDVDDKPYLAVSLADHPRRGPADRPRALPLLRTDEVEPREAGHEPAGGRGAGP